jgi:ABC-type Zn uptake system ZnuABC Zn-binding protein ZnuA
MKYSFRLFSFILVGALLSTGLLFAGGKTGTEWGNHDGSDHHEYEESIPDISAVQLEADQKLLVVASTSIVADVVANVGDDSIELTTLIEPGQDPHSYDPTPSALAAVEKAHVVFVNGFGLEEGLLDIIESTATGVVVPVSAGIEPLPMEQFDHAEHTHDHGVIDPHVWFDPTNVMQWVENIEHVLSEADPMNKQAYHERAYAYLNHLGTLDNSIRLDFDALPDSRKKLVTDHVFLGYFADQYGIEVIGTLLPNTTTSAETSARQIAGLVEVLQHTGITTIFVGSTAGTGLERLAESVAEEIGGEVNIVHILTGSLTAPGSQGDTYLGYMEYNARQIINGLKPDTE